MHPITILYASVLLFSLTPSTLFIQARPAIEAYNRQLSKEIDARLSSTISEVEWLLTQLVNILSEMVDGLEKDPSLLQNVHFRSILIQVIKRIDYVLEHFESVGPSVLTPNVNKQLQRIDCIRIRLANYVSQSKKYDTTKCYPPKSTVKPSGQTPTNSDILPLLTQIVSLLMQISSQLNVIQIELKPNTNYPNNGWKSTTTAKPMMPMTTIDINQLLTDYVSSLPMTGSTSAPNWNDFISSIMSNKNNTSTPSMSSSTQSWNDLISQVMGGMKTSTAYPASIKTTTPPTASTNWEDVMNDLIGQWSGSVAPPPAANKIDVQDCIDSIMSAIDRIQQQLPNSTTITNSTLY